MSTRPDPIPPPWRSCISGAHGCRFAPSQTFTCTGCQREVCWCSGGTENDLCAACDNQEHHHAIQK